MKRLFNGVVVALLIAQLALVLMSWLLSATMTEDVRSLISSEGVRWFFSHFSSMLATPWLVWLLLLSMAAGSLCCSGLLETLRPPRSPLHYRQRLALRTSISLLVVYMAGVAALTVVPHAVLLSATGQLWPSPFSRAVVPVLSFALLLVSIVYGWVSGRYATLADVLGSLCYGIAKAAPLFLIYVLFVQFYESLKFVFL